jgi:hypothetical protein
VDNVSKDEAVEIGRQALWGFNQLGIDAVIVTVNKGEDESTGRVFTDGSLGETRAKLMLSEASINTWRD